MSAAPVAKDSKLTITFEALTDVGLKRDHNEDACAADTETGLFVVCDGVGGALAGEIASGMTVARLVADHQIALERLSQGSGDGAPIQRLMHYLDQGLQRATDEVYSKAKEDPKLRGMGTTAVALAIYGAHATIAHVGDSRIYLKRGPKLYQLTDDHSIAHEMFRRGLITAEQRDNHPHKNAIIRAIGQQPEVQVDTSILELLPEDTFLLCSDGLTDQVSDAQILKVLADKAPGASERLIKMANDAGGKDNVTAIIVRVAGTAPAKRSFNTEEKVTTLGHFFLCKGLSFAQNIRVLAICNEVELDAGQVAVREGEVGSELYLVADGRLDVMMGGVKIGSLEPGDHFGELALIGDQTRTATVIAREPSFLLRIDRPDFSELLSEDPSMGISLLTRFLQNTALQIDALTKQVAELRVAARGAPPPGSGATVMVAAPSEPAVPAAPTTTVSSASVPAPQSGAIPSVPSAPAAPAAAAPSIPTPPADASHAPPAPTNDDGDKS